VPDALIAVLDANVLYPPTLRDFLLATAASGFYAPRWSDEILDEVARNLAKRMTPENAARLVGGMRELFPKALVEGYERHLPGLANEEKDRHVVATALEATAPLIVTGNRRDFSPLPASLQAIEADDFLCGFLDAKTELIRCVDRVRKLWPSPPSASAYLAQLGKLAPRFAAEMRQYYR